MRRDVALGGTLARRPVIAFGLLAFVWSWGYDVLVYLAVGPSPPMYLEAPRTWGPLLAAGLVTWAIGGDVREWASQITKWRVKPGWYLVAVILPILVIELEPILWMIGGGGLTLENGSRLSFVLFFVANFLLVTFFAGGLEEFGWRGFALPRLQEEYSALLAGTVIGIVWAFWHFPLFFLFELEWYQTFPSYVIALVAWSLVLTWIYNGTEGSLLLVMIAHGLSNTPEVLEQSGDLVTTEVFSVVMDNPRVLLFVLVAVLLVAHGSQYLASSGPTPRIPGEPESPADADVRSTD